MLRALDVTAQLLQNGTPVPPSILNQSIEFTKNFMLVCHHGKEEETLFPALERQGMPREGGPIARMIFEHGIAKELAAKLEGSSRNYQATGDSAGLVADIRSYVEHVSAHIAKENLRLFMMADMILKSRQDAVDKDLAATEQAKLSAVGKSRDYFEKLAGELSAGAASVQGRPET
jgi:hemerythrin-like domain-containing protein